MGRLDGTVRCDGCGVEVVLSPVVVDNLEYCCLDCSQGIRCKCAEQIELDDAGRNRQSNMDTSSAAYPQE